MNTSVLVRAALYVAATTATALAQTATNLIANPSFESPYYTSTQNLFGPFTLNAWHGIAGSLGSGGNAGVVLGSASGLLPSHGSHHFTFNGANPPAGSTLEQVFATPTATPIIITFDIGRSGRLGENLQLTASLFDYTTGATLTSAMFSPPTSTAYTSVALTFTPTSNLTLLRFTDASGANPNSDLYIDNISVATTGASAIPEPSTYAAIAGAAALAGACITRRRQRSP